MSNLQMIIEEDSESGYFRKKKLAGTTIVYKPNLQVSELQAQVRSSTPPAVSESEEEELSDPEIKKIKKLTKHLQSNVCSELKHHKKVYQQYIDTNKNLNKAVKDYTFEIEEVKTTAYSALAQSFQTCSEIKKIRESVSGRDSKLDEANPFEMLKTMKKEISNMQERLYANEMVIEEKEKENVELKNFIEKVNEEKVSIIEVHEQKIGCSKCVLI